MTIIRPISGFGGCYWVTENGAVTTTRRQGSPGGYMKQQIGKDGYHRVNLTYRGKRKTCLVHRLVAEAFIDNPDGKACVNHIDGDKGNNTVDNLEWCTYSENMCHAIARGLNKTPALSGENHPMAKLTQMDVDRIRELAKRGVQNSVLAKEYGVTKEAIGNIVKNKSWRKNNAYCL